MEEPVAGLELAVLCHHLKVFEPMMHTLAFCICSSFYVH